MFYFLFVVVFFSFFDPLEYRSLDLNSLVDCRLRLFHYTARTTVKINFLCGRGKSKVTREILSYSAGQRE
jgi:hypothetical protein